MSNLIDRYEVAADGCWVWTGPRMNGGYGVVSTAGRTLRAHIRRTQKRLGKDDLHLAAIDLRRQGLTWAEVADVLRWSSPASAHAAAMTYAVKKGLVDPADLPRKRFMTAEDRAEMTAMYRAGSRQREIAEAFGIHSSQVSRIVRGMTSGHSRKQARKDKK